MDKIKREDIDNMILESFKTIDGEKIIPQFLDNLNTIQSILRENKTDPNGRDAFYTASFLSCIITAQTNAIHTMREVLCKIFCKDETGGKPPKAEHETIVPMKQKVMDEIMKTLSSYNLSVSETREILMASSKRLGNQKICM